MKNYQADTAIRMHAIFVWKKKNLCHHLSQGSGKKILIYQLLIQLYIEEITQTCMCTNVIVKLTVDDPLFNIRVPAFNEHQNMIRHFDVFIILLSEIVGSL